MQNSMDRANGPGSRTHFGAALRATLLCLTLVTGCVIPGFGMEPPNIAVLDVRPISGGTLEQRLELDLLVQNTNNFDISIDGMRLRLDLNGQPLGRAVSREAFSVGRLDEARVTVEASITFLDVARQLLSAGSQQSLDSRPSFEYRVAGDVFIVEPRSTRLSFEDAGDVLPTRRSR